VAGRTILLGKMAGALAGVLALVVPGLLAAVVWLAATDLLGTGDLGRTAALVASHALYLSVCAGVAVVVSAWSRSSRAAVLTLTTAWMLLWVALPQALPAVAARLYPVPSRAAFEAAIGRDVRALGDSHNPDDPNFQRLRIHTLEKYGVSRVEELPINYNGVVMTEGEKHSAQAFAEHMGRLADAYHQQSRVMALGGWVSPFLAIRTVAMALSGSDTAHALEFERQAEAYRYDLIQYLNGLHTTEVALARDRYDGSPEGGAPSRQRIDRRHWSDAPLFDYQPPSLSWALAQQPVGVAALAGWPLLLALAVRRTRMRL
jgi:ABC-2 type transport system permease protein